MERRFFIALGSNRYQHLPAAKQLEFVQTDKQAAARLFGDFGYEPALPGLGEYDGADQIRQKLRLWATDVALTSDDIVVLYFAGHGVTAPSDRHYLFCWDSSPEDLAATALATEDLVRILCNGDLRHLLLVLDTCAGGAGSAEATALALQRLVYGNPERVRQQRAVVPRLRPAQGHRRRREVHRRSHRGGGGHHRANRPAPAVPRPHLGRLFRIMVRRHPTLLAAS
ncbi:caspase family protein [Streptomyces sp. NPDC054995]